MSASQPPAPWLTVAVPVFNVEPYLRQCVESVLRQADEGVELLLLDDASTDASPALMAALATEFAPQVRLLGHAHNQGLSAARNTMIDHARGEHLWFIDSDDWIAADILPRLKALLSAHESPDLVFCDYRVVRGRERLKYRLRGEHHRPGFAGPSMRRLAGGPALLEAVLATGNLFAWAHVSRRSLWHGGPRFPAGRSFEDMATTPRLVLRAGSAWHVPEPWLMYRRRDDSLSALMSARKVADLSAALLGVRAEMLARWPEVPDATRAALAHQAARNLIAAQRHALRLPRDEAAALLPRCRADFDATVGDDVPLLMRHYLRRGWWWRAWRLRAALRLKRQ